MKRCCVRHVKDRGSQASPHFRTIAIFALIWFVVMQGDLCSARLLESEISRCVHILMESVYVYRKYTVRVTKLGKGMVLCFDSSVTTGISLAGTISSSHIHQGGRAPRLTHLESDSSNPLGFQSSVSSLRHDFSTRVIGKPQHIGAVSVGSCAHQCPRYSEHWKSSCGSKERNIVATPMIESKTRG